MSKIILLTEGSEEFGFGHITRCTAFYDIFNEQNHTVEFIINGDHHIKNILKNRKYKLINWHGAIRTKLANHLDCDILIIDSYHITQSEADFFSEINVKLVVLEDFVRRQYKNTLIIDWSLNAELLECYNKKEETNTYLLGVDYLVVRKPFEQMVNLPKSKNQLEVLVTLGGSDIRNLTIPIVNTISKLNPTIQFHAVLGKENLTEKFQDNKNIQIHRNLDEIEMAKVMQKCHLAISGGGQTLYELAILNVSIIAIELINNQKDELKLWEDYGLLMLNLKWNETNLINKINTVVSKFKLEDVKHDNLTFGSKGIKYIHKKILTS